MSEKFTRCGFEALGLRGWVEIPLLLLTIKRNLWFQLIFHLPFNCHLKVKLWAISQWWLFIAFTLHGTVHGIGEVLESSAKDNGNGKETLTRKYTFA